MKNELKEQSYPLKFKDWLKQFNSKEKHQLTPLDVKKKFLKDRET